MPRNTLLGISGILAFSDTRSRAIIRYNQDGPPPVIVVARPVRAGQTVRDAFPDGVENPANYTSKGVGAIVSQVRRQYRLNGGAWISE